MSGNTWLRPEKGNRLTAYLLIKITKHLGPRVASWLRGPATLYYAIFHPAVRRASWRYLTHLYNAGKLNRRPHPLMVLSHIYAYSTNVLDRILLISGRFDPTKIQYSGTEHLHDALQQGKGCILMGAHIGSFDALRHFGLTASVRFRMLMYRRFVGATSQLIETFAPNFNADIIELGQPDSMLTTVNALKQGQFVGILADRAHNQGRSLAIPFLGHKAPLPAGPFQLAALTGAPVVLVSALRQKNGSYHIACEPLLDTLLTNKTTASVKADPTPLMSRYAQWMEGLCQRHPFAWFNFFDFWEEGL
ncbi:MULTISPECIES: acyltransferase [unclassified Saccharibacter]|uniref:LpxL/LpxP family acyltransferase n=1 Tax=unclassified Saccharibacter TaxID=2648722 RepID=UPI001325FD4C|nr:MULTISPECIES: acyltransferase [unclassified Saccharibacter]MXV36878.1 acyltransferase [Saccharibacter sp. EH611]MXV58632.1 acyltransferase [Saccharibacter sp. EH70]MXV66138.1 acyltransferase [Saccharibacter sp. EH60]